MGGSGDAPSAPAEPDGETAAQPAAQDTPRVTSASPQSEANQQVQERPRKRRRAKRGSSEETTAATLHLVGRLEGALSGMQGREARLLEGMAELWRHVNDPAPGRPPVEAAAGAGTPARQCGRPEGCGSGAAAHLPGGARAPSPEPGAARASTAPSSAPPAQAPLPPAPAVHRQYCPEALQSVFGEAGRLLSGPPPQLASTLGSLDPAASLVRGCTSLQAALDIVGAPLPPPPPAAQAPQPVAPVPAEAGSPPLEDSKDTPPAGSDNLPRQPS